MTEINDYWEKFADSLLVTNDDFFRLLGLKMIENTITPENLDEVLKLIESKDFEIPFNDEKFKRIIKTNKDVIIKNQIKLTSDQTKRLYNRFVDYKESGLW